MDSLAIGIILGLLGPVAGFFAYGTIYVTAIKSQYDLHWFVNDLFIGTPPLRARVLSLSLVADALIFFALDRFHLYKSMRGVIAAMLAYAVVVIIFLF